MQTKKVSVNGRPCQVTQFQNLDEALNVLPKELVLKFINTGWQNTQMYSCSDAMRKNPR